MKQKNVIEIFRIWPVKYCESVNSCKNAAITEKIGTKTPADMQPARKQRKCKG